MFIIRNIEEQDLDDLYELSQLQTFINLPASRDVLRKKIITSQASFRSPHKNLEHNYYLFVIEDLEKKKIIGASMIHAKHGTDQEPHFYLKVSREHKFSSTINTGFIHGTLKLGIENDGWSEIGGLILHPEYRGHSLKLGKQLSYSRFLYMGTHLDSFTEKIHCELMPPFDEKGQAPLWEAIGRLFMNMNYDEADRLSRENKEFILSLFPSDTIYETLLPLSARNAIGKVGESTLPVKKMLEKIGFKYCEEVDPFDGGPHYRAKKTDIKPIKDLYIGNYEFKKSLDNYRDILLCNNCSKEKFRAIIANGRIENQSLQILDPEGLIAKQIEVELGVKGNSEIQAIFTDY